eukprot:SAG11_NODE_13552_length_650_cov_0.834846_1_plen_71_part_01
MDGSAEAPSARKRQCVGTVGTVGALDTSSGVLSGALSASDAAPASLALGASTAAALSARLGGDVKRTSSPL